MSNDEYTTLQRQLQAMALLCQLQRKARAAKDLETLGFAIVNESRAMLEYRQAVLWTPLPTPRVAAVSGVALLDAQAPYIVWLAAVCKHQNDKADSVQAGSLSAADLPEALAKEWAQWLPPFALWLPLKAFDTVVGGLLLAKDKPWQDSEAVLLSELADAYGHAWQALLPKTQGWRRFFGNKALRRWALGIALLLALPVRQSVLAPAEVTASKPTIVRAPLEGVVGEFFVQPNQSVVSGQSLLLIDNTDIANRLEISRKALAVAEAEYRKAGQQAVFDPKSKSEVAILKTKTEQHQAEVAYMEDQMHRSELKAPQAGIAVFSDVHDWIGRPVSLGEKILMVADPDLVELEMRVPVADLIELDDGADAVMFLNVEPQHPVEASVYSVSYQAEAGADDVLAYKVKARLKDGEKAPRIGMKGTAKLYGKRVSLFYYLFRRPMSGLRQWLGW